MSEYYICGPKAREALSLLGVHLVDDWKDGTYNVEVMEDCEDRFIEWCDANQIEAKLV